MNNVTLVLFLRNVNIKTPSFFELGVILYMYYAIETIISTIALFFHNDILL